MRMLVLLMAGAVVLRAQQPATMGTVATRDAKVTGGLEVRGELVSLMTNASVTAYDRTARIELARGGEVLVCSTSQFHLLHGGAGPSLVFALDRGAVEIRSKSQPQDVLLTPDLQFTLAATGDLDLRVRVTREGDTCVENAGAHAPGIQIADVFSSATYHLNAGQHVMFEHGSLREVVDRETSACGCPAGAPATMVAGGAEAANPFPEAVSSGLAPAAVAANMAPVGEKGTQVSATLAVGTAQAGSTEVPVVGVSPVSAEPPPSPPGARDLVHVVGGFFRKLFHRKG